MAFLRYLLLVVFLAFPAKASGKYVRLGINYGTLGNDLPSHRESIRRIQSLGAGSVKIYDANHDILRALAGTRLGVAIMVPNEIIPNIGATSSISEADKWVLTNVAPFNSTVRLQYLLVGNEVLSFPSTANTIWPYLVPAMAKLRKCLKARGFGHIKVGTTLSMDSLKTNYPPSAGEFRDDIAIPIIRPLLRFLSRTKSFYFVDVYPYLDWTLETVGKVSLDYALFEGKPKDYLFDPATNLTYTNLFDVRLDALATAMARLGYGDVRIVVAETGWPNSCDYDQAGGNIRNAAIYNRNLARRLAVRPSIGTPARPGMDIHTFIFALYNENLKGGPGTERHWGLLYPNGTKVYEVDLSGQRPVWSYPPLPEATNNEAYKGPIWCIQKGGPVNETELGPAMTYACGQRNGTCDAIQPGGKCYEPNRVEDHANYAFNSYWQQFRNSSNSYAGGTCFFNGLAVQTLQDPSHGLCKFQSTIDN